MVDEIPVKWLPEWLMWQVVSAGEQTRIPVTVNIELFMQPSAEPTLMQTGPNTTTMKQAFDGVVCRVSWDIADYEECCAREHWFVRHINRDGSNSISDAVHKWDKYLKGAQ